jgi:hypothetical protein
MKMIGKCLLALVMTSGVAVAGDKEDCEAISPQISAAITSNKMCRDFELTPRRAELNTLLNEVQPLVVAMPATHPYRAQAIDYYNKSVTDYNAAEVMLLSLGPVPTPPGQSNLSITSLIADNDTRYATGQTRYIAGNYAGALSEFNVVLKATKAVSTKSFQCWFDQTNAKFWAIGAKSLAVTPVMPMTPPGM